MSFIDVLCSEFDIETDEEWRGNDGYKYKLKLNGEILKYHPIEGKWKIITGEDYADIVNGSVYPQWLQMGATYYIPALDEENKYIQMEWLDCDEDRVNRLRGLVFKNKKDAITMTNRLLSVIEGGK